MSRSRIPIFVAVLLPLLCLVAGCGGGGDDPDPVPAPADLYAPIFRGLTSGITAGDAFVRLEWAAAVDNVTPAGSIRYRVYAGSASGGQDFSTPILTTGAGATSVVLAGPSSPLVAVGAESFYVVRAVDAAGNEDRNAVELAVRPVARAAVAFVSDMAAGAGTLGDPADPFPTLQAGVDAVEGHGEGVVLVDAASGGTTYPVPADLRTHVTSIGLFGGFARFAGLPPAWQGADVLALRDVENHETLLAPDLAAPVLPDEDFVHVENGGAKTSVDGFTYRDDRVALTPLTGTLTYENWNTYVTGTGTLFQTELEVGDLIGLDSGEILGVVNWINSDTALYLDEDWTGDDGTSSASILVYPDDAGLGGIDARLQVSGCRLGSRAYIRAGSSGPSGGSTLTFTGNKAAGTAFTAFAVDGACDVLRFQNNTVTGYGSALKSSPDETALPPLQMGSIDPPEPGSIAVPPTGLEVLVTHNLLSRNRDSLHDGLIRLEFEPVDAMSGGALDVLAEHNEMRDHEQEALAFYQVGNVGTGGSATVVIRDNLLNGAGQSQVELSVLGWDMVTDTQVDPYPGVDVSIEIYDNEILNGNSIPIDVELGVSEERTTSLSIRDNLIMVAESEGAEVTDEDTDTPGVSDRGVILMEYVRNVSLGGVEDIEFEVGVAHGGRTQLDVFENTVLSSEDEGFNLDVEDYLGTEGEAYPYPDGVYVFNVFNNDVEAHDDEAIEIRDERTESSRCACIAYIGHNFAQNGADPGDGAIHIEYRGPHAGWLVERNLAGLGGADSSETGFELESDGYDLPTEMRLVNNVATLGSGGGFSWGDRGGVPQLVNCTAAYAGQDERYGFGLNRADVEGGDQTLVLNCISSHSGGMDVEWTQGLRPVYTLIRDTTTPGGLGNIGGEPFYAKEISDLTFLGDHAWWADVFTLQPTSPAVDAGHPGAIFRDPDGSRNNMGAYGGPNAGPLGFVTAGAPMPFVHVGTYPAVHLWTGATLHEAGETIHLGFTCPADAASLAAGLSVTSGGVAVPVTLDTIGDGHLVRIAPDPVFAPGSFVEVRVNGGLRNASGAALAYPATIRFAVRPDAGVPEVEPNDDGTPGVDAADLSAAQVLGVGPARAVFEVAGDLADLDDVDVYEITAAVGDRLMATILDARLVGASDDPIRVDLYNAAGVRISEGRVGGFEVWGVDQGDPYVDHTFWFAGTYTLVVTSLDQAGTARPYVLQGVLDRED